MYLSKNTFLKLFIYIEIRAFHSESYKLVLWVSKFGVWHTKWGRQKHILQDFIWLRIKEHNHFTEKKAVYVLEMKLCVITPDVMYTSYKWENQTGCLIPRLGTFKKKKKVIYVKRNVSAQLHWKHTAEGDEHQGGPELLFLERNASEEIRCHPAVFRRVFGIFSSFYVLS